MMRFAFASSAPWYQHRRGKQCSGLYNTLLLQAMALYIHSPLPCKNLLGSIPNPLNVQHPPGTALQLHDSVDLNKIAT